MLSVPLKLKLFDLLKHRQTSKFLKEFIAITGKSEAEIAQYRFNKLKRLLAHAYEKTEFYKARFDSAGVDVYKLNDFEQLRKIPPLTREDLQKSWKQIISNSHDQSRLSKGSSSGSTGYPVTYFHDATSVSAGHAAGYLGWGLSGWHFGLKGLHVWGNPSTVLNEWSRLSSKIKAKVFSLHKFPAYRLTEGNMFYDLLDKVNSEEYDFIEGYTNAIYLFALFLERENLSVKKRPKLVLTTAENLQEHQRSKIEKHLGSVYDCYGCSEINGIAFQCNDCRQYHVIEPHVYTEFGNTVDEFENKELIITDLDNYAFPLIRYKNDDLVLPFNDNAGSCTIPFERWKAVSGRQSDILALPGGGVLSVPSFFGSMLLKKINGISQYQVEKTESDNININFVATEAFKDGDLKNIKESLDEYLKNKINYNIRFVDKIEVSKTGKFKLLIDKTKND